MLTVTSVYSRPVGCSGNVPTREAESEKGRPQIHKAVPRTSCPHPHALCTHDTPSSRTPSRSNTETLHSEDLLFSRQ